MAYLEIETNEGTRRIALERERLSIGRLSYNDVMLPSPQISRQHAELRRIEGRWWIADLNSTNGLHLNERRIQEHLLADGDVIVLAPGICLRFVEEAGDAQQAASRPASSSPRLPVAGTSSGTFSTSGVDWGAYAAQQLKQASSDPQAHRLTHPIGQPFPTSAQVYPPVTPPNSIAPLKPRSIYADDEVPYVPPGMAAPPATPQPSFTPAPMPSPAARNGGPPTIPFSSWNTGAAPSSSNAPGTPNSTMPMGGAGMSGDRYPAPPGPLQSGAGTEDPYRRSGPLIERSNPTGGQSNTTLLHVCQTCGQLTAPDAVYCQNCHHSIAHECSNCRLSLLPIQERCPRCHTPNEASVRRAHPGR